MPNKKYITDQDAAYLINAYDFAIFPTHGIYDGKCTCGEPKCGSPGKHPATADGFKSASNDVSPWLKPFHYNVGIATGAKSGIFVIDIDSAEGEKNFAALGETPQTLSVTTGKGRHLYFHHPGESVITKKGILPGVDVRGDGGYVCGPGSNHISGNRYEWINPLEVIQDAPDFILDLVVKSRIKEAKNAANINHSPRLMMDNRWTIDDARDHLAHINPDIGYDEWVMVGMALQNEGFGFHLFDEWSAKGSKYVDRRDCETHWRSFHTGGGVSYGSIVYMAQQGGWKPKEAMRPVALPGKPIEVVDPDTGEIIELKRERNPKARKLPLIYADDIVPITTTNDFVEGLLCENQFSVIYGQSNCGKTFFMMDLALHVALGAPWRGREVEQGGVIYAALEGGHAAQNRIAAFRQHFSVEDPTKLAIIPCSLNLLDPNGDIHSLIEAIWDAKERIGNIRLVVIDTLSRALHGGDENSSEDMGQLIINADAIRAVTGAHIAFVHHSGKDELKGARGHSSLRAAVDTEIEISRPDKDSPSKIAIVKQRDMEMGEDTFFSLRAVELGQNRRGKPVTSCVVIPCEGNIRIARELKMTPQQQFVYDALVNAIIGVGKDREMYRGTEPVSSVDYVEFYEALENSGYKELLATENKTTEQQVKSATQTARLALKKMGKINFNKKYLWLVDCGENVSGMEE